VQHTSDFVRAPTCKIDQPLTRHSTH
jgi:hypothetical protein